MRLILYTHVKPANSSFLSERFARLTVDRECFLFVSGAFLIPYFIMLIFEGVPVFYLELSIGQRLRQGAINVWSTVCPYLGGMGIATTVICILVCSYYNVVIAWVLFYFYNSFRSPLPWAECPKVDVFNSELNRTEMMIPKECDASSPTAYYYHRETLMHARRIEESAEINWKLAVALVVAWVVAYLCIIKSIQSSGKVLQKAHLMVNRPHRTAVKMNKIKKGQGFENEIRAPLKK